jgi:uncharacterized protein YjbI with pentapeptide repeats
LALSGADLSEPVGDCFGPRRCTAANLTGANLRGANLYKANLTGADLVGATISTTTIFCHTTMPNRSINNGNC